MTVAETATDSQARMVRDQGKSDFDNSFFKKRYKCCP